MAQIDRKLKRELARATKARNLRERRLMSSAYDVGVGMGIEFQKQKVDYSTLAMGYLYEYPVENSVEGSSSDPVDTNSVPVAPPSHDSRYDYPDADSIPA